ncbi:hypothetical protein N7453_006075 [Penicillium expansum]|nr:hypothetical protein N7453_006075 [Penicillium expansum]
MAPWPSRIAAQEDGLALPTNHIPSAISAEPGASPHPTKTQARPINARKRDLLDSLYEMLVECANRTDSRVLQAVESQCPIPSSDDETTTGHTAAQKHNNTHHSKGARKQRQAIQRRRKRENRLSVTVPSLSPHFLNPEFPSSRPSFETQKNKVLEGNHPRSAPPIHLPSQTETTTYAGSPFINPRHRPASASGNLPHTQSIRGVAARPV